MFIKIFKNQGVILQGRVFEDTQQVLIYFKDNFTDALQHEQGKPGHFSWAP